jgi:small-conductance mechanosensitive channel
VQLPDWATNLIIFSVAILVALFVHRVALGVLDRIVRKYDNDNNNMWRTLVDRMQRLGILALILVTCVIAAEFAPLSPDGRILGRQVFLVAFIALAGWSALVALHIWTSYRLRRLKSGDDDFFARKQVTQSRILERIAGAAIIVITISSALMTFDEVRQFGVSLFASAGIAGIVLGIALQPVLKNLIAGVQLAFTQPIRIDDAVIVEGEWGTVEEITSTYVVIKLWDLRRLIVPLSYFLEQPFQNWTREGRSLIGVVFLYVDFTVPVDALRQHLTRILEQSPLWDRQVAALQVTDFKPETMEIRMLAGAANAGQAFELRCEVRERMIAYLQANYPNSLPRRRVVQYRGDEQMAAAGERAV